MRIAMGNASVRVFRRIDSRLDPTAVLNSFEKFERRRGKKASPLSRNLNKLRKAKLEARIRIKLLSQKEKKNIYIYVVIKLLMFVQSYSFTK